MPLRIGFGLFFREEDAESFVEEPGVFFCVYDNLIVIFSPDALGTVSHDQLYFGFRYDPCIDEGSAKGLTAGLGAASHYAELSADLYYFILYDIFRYPVFIVFRYL